MKKILVTLVLFIACCSYGYSQCNVCHGTGSVKHTETCKTCNGVGSFKSTVEKKCNACYGKGVISGRCNTCSGSGELTKQIPVTCSSCSGSGKGEQINQYLQANCKRCNGTGTTYKQTHSSCSSCGGTGKKTFYADHVVAKDIVQRERPLLVTLAMVEANLLDLCLVHHVADLGKLNHY